MATETDSKKGEVIIQLRTDADAANVIVKAFQQLGFWAEQRGRVEERELKLMTIDEHVVEAKKELIVEETKVRMLRAEKERLELELEVQELKSKEAGEPENIVRLREDNERRRLELEKMELDAREIEVKNRLERAQKQALRLPPKTITGPRPQGPVAVPKSPAESVTKHG